MKATQRSWLLILAQAVLCIAAAPLIALAIIVLLTGCSSRALQEVNNLAPDPPHMGQRHSGLDRAEYLRVTEPLEASK